MPRPGARSRAGTIGDESRGPARAGAGERPGGDGGGQGRAGGEPHGHRRHPDGAAPAAPVAALRRAAAPRPARLLHHRRQRRAARRRPRHRTGRCLPGQGALRGLQDLHQCFGQPRPPDRLHQQHHQVGFECGEVLLRQRDDEWRGPPSPNPPAPSSPRSAARRMSSARPMAVPPGRRVPTPSAIRARSRPSRAFSPIAARIISAPPPTAWTGCAGRNRT